MHTNPKNPMSPPVQAEVAAPFSPKRKVHVAPYNTTTGILRWVTQPASSIKLVAIPIVLHLNWLLVAPFVAPGMASPFAPFLYPSHPLPGTESPSGGTLYEKGYLDVVFMAYHIVVFCFLRQFLMQSVCIPFGRYMGITKKATLERFGEQGYAFMYFFAFAIWGTKVMSTLPTWWFKTEHFWIDYPHWEMQYGMKHYYLVNFSYWISQLLVLVLGLEKPRKDYWEIVLHHIVTLWMVSFGYYMNTTHIGNAVFLSMDASEVFFSFSKLLNYLDWKRAKIWSFAIFMTVWAYFRHYISIKILYSVWYEWKLIPEGSRDFRPFEGYWMCWWMRYQIFGALFVLQCLNLYWFRLIVRIAIRAIMTADATDSRSDDEEEEEEEAKKVQ